MSIESYLLPYRNRLEPSAEAPAPAPEMFGHSLDDLLHGKARILSRKLAILGAEIWWRLHLTSRNLEALEHDQARVRDLLNRLDIAANYRLRDHQEKGPLYRKLFDLDAEKRTQQVECWRDVVQVMRDFLAVWEAHEQAQSRAIFLHHVGTGSEGPL